jgi:HD-GYP domain-containing protein (c-di-GMP phosphodiesterase class II)
MSNISAFISFIALLFYCVLLIAILSRKLRSKLDLFFALYLLSMIVWSLGSFMIFAELPLLSTVFWNRFMVVGSMGMPIAFFAFAQTFLLKERSSWLLLGLFSYLLTQLANTLGFIITDAHVVEGLLFNQWGPAILIPSVTWALFVGLLGYDLFIEYRQTQHAASRNRIKYLLLVTILTFAGSLTNATQLQVFPIDIAFNALSALLISYAILRHHLLDIKLVVRLGLLHSIPTMIIGAAYFLVISLAINLFHAASGTQLFLLSIFVAILTALIVQPLRDKAQNWIDRLFFREKYDASLMLQRISSTAASVLDLDRLTNLILDEITTTLHIQRAAFFTRHNGKAFTLSTHKGLDHDPNLKLPLSHPLVLWLSTNQQPLTSSDMDVLPQFKALWDKERQELETIGAELFIPLIVSSELVGILAVGPKRSELLYSFDDQLTLTTLANQTAVAIEKARLYSVAQRELADRERAEKQLQLQLQRISALHEIDVSITTTVNLKATLQVLLEQVVNQLRVDAAAVGLLDSTKHMLEYVTSRGFNPNTLNHFEPVSEGTPAGRAIRDKSLIYIPSLAEKDISSASLLVKEEKFVTCIVIPLIAKAQVKGVLEIYHRSQLNTDPEWLDFLESLATEAAIVVDNAYLFEELQESNLELEQAYKNTLEGWSRALELRDRETDGHSQRVTEMTLKLAEHLGIEEEQLIHIRRGALLHDIGKMGIPDSLLLKPGPLTSEEIDLMRLHPIYAYELLSVIPFLRTALDIPYCHHEKWDGSGYPRGLAGEQIPMAARIFAVADVWDALLSDRPYRPAWSKAEALTYIREQSGRHFDPKVVHAFMEVLDQLDSLREDVLILDKQPTYHIG